MKRGGINEFFWKWVGKVLEEMGYEVEYRVSSADLFGGVPTVMVDLVVRDGEGKLLALVKFDMRRGYGSLAKMKSLAEKVEKLGYEDIDVKYFTWFVGKEGERAEFLDKINHDHIIRLGDRKFVLPSYEADEFRSYLKRFGGKKDEK